ncbi:unnamed protein product [Prunus armeniaca]
MTSVLHQFALAAARAKFALGPARAGGTHHETRLHLLRWRCLGLARAAFPPVWVWRWRCSY